jgi:hypothetical protein
LCSVNQRYNLKAIHNPEAQIVPATEVEFSDEIIEVVTGFSKGVKSFIKDVKKNKMTIQELVAFHRVLVKNPEWYTLFN